MIRIPNRSHPCATALLLASLLALSLPGCREATSDAYPSRSVFIICPWGVGGGTDTVSRFVANLLEKETGRPFSVINRTGGGGVTGHTAGAVARPNGYTILMITVEIAMMHHRGLTDINYEKFAPVMLINRDSASLFVRADSPWKTYADLRRDIEKRPGDLRASGTALGGIWHLGLTGLLMASGYKADDIVWVPSNGAGPALQELMSDNIHAVVCSLPEASALLGAGRIRCLGVMSEKRLKPFPEVPTFVEQGVDWTLGGWRGLALPRGTPPEIIRQLEAIVERVVTGETFQSFMAERGFDASIERAAQFRETMRSDDEKFGRLLAESITAPEGRGWVPGPWFFPGVLACGVILIAAVMIGTQRSLRFNVNRKDVAVTAEVVAAVAVYVVLADVVGFLIMAAIIGVYFLRRLGNRWSTSVLVTLLLVPGIYALFAKLMRVPLPRGWIPW